MSEQTVTLEEQVKQALARGYCHPDNSHKEMDGTLAYAMAEEVMKIMPTLLESKPFRPTIKKVVVNPSLSLDIFFNEQELLPINVELELKFQEPQPTKYPLDFTEWMKKKNFILNDGKFFADDLVQLSDEQVGKLWDEFIDIGYEKDVEQKGYVRKKRHNLT